MRYLSVCSGIEAATVAWHPLGWAPVAYAEIDPFPCAVLAHHYPTVPNWGDLTQFQTWPHAHFDLLVGGTPCQAFSVAGLRQGLADPRGNLALTYLAVADRYRPRWLVWENVPGVLSSGGGRDFGAFLGALGQLGYGFAYRVLDAQYFGLAQRRARVFVVGHLGGWRRAAAVLFERESLSGHPAPRRETGQDVAGTLASRTSAGGGLGTDFDIAGGVIPSTGDISHCLNVGGMGRTDYETETRIAHALRGDGFDASEDGTGRGTPLVHVVNGNSTPETMSDCAFPLRADDGSGNRQAIAPYTLAIRGRGDSYDLEYRQDGVANAVLTPNGGRGGIGVGAIAFTAKDYGADAGDLAPTLRAGGFTNSHANAGVMPAVAFDWQSGGDSRGLDPKDTAQLQRCQVPAVAFSTSALDSPRDNGTTPPLRCNLNGQGTSAGPSVMASVGMQVRRLTPRECERLQGFPDDYTLIPYRGKPTADGPRYKALGNSMAVPVMAWIGRRIAQVDAQTPRPAEHLGFLRRFR